ncbi:MAG TPA: helix-turn-helix transcriptional regulator [Pirellulales bacterium]|nr:helix-turn-helix transcriptional regulator [Pirellulales bacterium]
MSDTLDKKQLIARRLREARKLAGLSQGQVAKMMDLHRPTISEIEAGNRNVTVTELTRFAEIYDVSVAWLSGEGGDQLQPQDERLQLAFRELQKLKPDDLDKLMRALAALRGPREGE